MIDEIPNVNEIEKIYNLKHVSDYLKIKADKYINNTYGDNFNALEDEEFYCI